MSGSPRTSVRPRTALLPLLLAAAPVLLLASPAWAVPATADGARPAGTLAGVPTAAAAATATATATATMTATATATMTVTALPNTPPAGPATAQLRPVRPPVSASTIGPSAPGASAAPRSGASGSLLLSGVAARQAVPASPLTLPLLAGSASTPAVAQAPLLAGVLPVVAPAPAGPAVQVAPAPGPTPLVLAPVAARATSVPTYADLVPAAALVIASAGGLVVARHRRRAS